MSFLKYGAMLLAMAGIALVADRNEKKLAYSQEGEKGVKSAYAVSMPRKKYSIVYTLFWVCEAAFLTSIVLCTIGVLGFSQTQLIFWMCACFVFFTAFMVFVRRKLVVRKDELIRYRLLSAKAALFKDLSGAEIDEKDRIILYIENKKFLTVGKDAINRDLLERDLKGWGKLTSSHESND
ncbi:MAG: hypothetical protein ACOX6J_04230 [Oscillospiraceae bacterium]|jgi:hypothetical protein